MVIQLLGTSGCHLCDVAEKMVRRLLPPLGIDVLKIDIASDDKLIEQYGILIPLMRNEKGQELGWPFDEAELLTWVKQ